MLAGGFSPDSLGVLSRDRCEEARKWAVMSMDELKNWNFGTKVESAAMDILLSINKDLEHIDQKRMQGDESEWEKVTILLKKLIDALDFLLSETQSLFAAMAVYRQAWLRWKGSMRIKADRIELLCGLLPMLSWKI